MSIAAIADHQPSLPVPSRVGQATAVEQSRAIAEVQAQVIVAQQMPRNVDRAVREMARSCAQKSLAEKAFYRFRRGTSQVSGESIVLAKELARCWGNIQYGIAELRRDDVAGESEMLAFAWDVETNARASTTFIVPHVRDTTQGRKALADVRDIYENNANMGARRQREMIFAVLPGWYTEDAKAACYKTLSSDDSDGATLAERAANAAERFTRIGVKAEQLVQKVGAPQSRWSAGDLAQLAVIYRSIERGETSKEDEFGTTGGAVTAADITGRAEPEQPAPAQQRRRSRAAATNASPAATAPRAPETQPAPPAERAAGEAPDERPTAQASSGQLSKISSALERLGYRDSNDKRLVAGRLAGISHLPEGATLNQEQAALVFAALDRCKTNDDLDALLHDGEVPSDR